jgi:hypothetical protein
VSSRFGSRKLPPVIRSRPSSRYCATGILEGHSLQFRFEAFNLTNHPNWNTPPANAQKPSTFGVVTTPKAMRQMQVALKYRF